MFVNVQVTEQRNKIVIGKTIAAATLKRVARPRAHARTQADKARNINSPKLFPYVFYTLISENLAVHQAGF